MAKQIKRIFDQLPRHTDLRKAAFEYILSGRPYFGPDLAKAVAIKLNVPEVDLNLKLPKRPNKAAFENYVDHVLREFTSRGIHERANTKSMYYATDLGLEIARRAKEADAVEIEKLLQERPDTPTDDPDILWLRVKKLLRDAGGKADSLPTESSDLEDVPQAPLNTSRFLRKPGVVARVLLRAKGSCEVCDARVPFLAPDGSPFLEVDHVRPLASGGPDRSDNAVAACPNCHRELHHGNKKEAR